MIKNNLSVVLNHHKGIISAENRSVNQLFETEMFSIVIVS